MSSKTQYKNYTKDLKKKVIELENELKKTNEILSNCSKQNARLIVQNENLTNKLKVRELSWKVVFIRKNKVKSFLYDLYKRLSSFEFGSSSGDTLYIMWDNKKCIKDKFEELLKI